MNYVQMNLIHYAMTATPSQIDQQNRFIYGTAFVFACGWGVMLFLSEGFRDMHKLWIPGGVKTATVILVLIIAIAAILLH